MDISHWDAAIHYGVQLAQYCDQTLSCNAISPRSLPLCSLALRLRNTKVPVLTHESIGYPKMDISHWDAAIRCGVQLAQYCDQTLSCNAISPRSPPLFSLALRPRNTKVPVLTHESIGYPELDISHWDAAIHFGDQLAQYYDQTPILTYFTEIAPCVLPCPKTQEHQCTVVLIKFLPYSGATAQTRSVALWGVSGSYGQAPAQQGMSGLVRETSHLWLYSSPSPSLQPILGETATSVLIVLYTFECIMWVATESLWRYVQGNK